MARWGIRWLSAVLATTLGFVPAAVANTQRDPRLRPATVALADLPDGWAEAELGNDDEGDEADAPCGLEAEFDDDLVVGRYSVTYSSGGLLGAYVVSAAARMRPGRARRVVDSIRAALKKGCPAETKDGETTTYRELKVPKLGDRSVGLRMASSGGAMDSSVDVVYIQRGDVLAIVGSFGIMSPAPPVVQLASKVAKRMTR